MTVAAGCSRSGGDSAVVAGVKRSRDEMGPAEVTERREEEEDMYGGSTDEGEDMDTDVGW